MTDQGPLPYYENQYPEKITLFGDAARTLLDTYGRANDDQPIDIVAWSDVEIATSYELARFQPHAVVDGRQHQIDLKVTEAYPNGEVSIKTHSINTYTMTKSTRIQQMTAAERADYEERIRVSKAHRPILPEEQLRILPPRRDALEPEHDMELLLGVLNRAFEILEQ